MPKVLVCVFCAEEIEAKEEENNRPEVRSRST